MLVQHLQQPQHQYWFALLFSVEPNRCNEVTLTFEAVQVAHCTYGTCQSKVSIEHLYKCMFLFPHYTCTCTFPNTRACTYWMPVPVDIISMPVGKVFIVLANKL